MSENPRIRDRKFCALLYPEDPTHAAAIEKLKTGGYNFAAILHNKDVYEDGENKGQIKKPHWHVVVKFTNAVWRNATAKSLGIEPNYLQQCSNVDAALLYLVHEGHPEKHQYDIEEVFGTLKTKLASLLRDDDESTRALTIYELIRSNPNVVTYTDIFEKACKGGLYSDFRRMGAGVSYLIREHNDEVLRETGLKNSFQRFNDVAGTLAKNMPFDEYIKAIERQGYHVKIVGGLDDA